MKRKVISIIVMAEGLFLAGQSLQAQPDTNLQSAPLSATETNRPAFRGNQTPSLTAMPEQQSFREAIMSLRRAKLRLQNSKDDFGGHQKTAIEACDKAIQELELVLRSRHSAPGASWVPNMKSAPKQENKQ